MTTKTMPPPRTEFEPPLKRWPPAGVYQLWLRVSVELRLRVGRLGGFAFPAGIYVYTGRASRGLAARVRRHVRMCRGCVRRDFVPSLRTHGGRGTRQRAISRKHWHIDYLLARREVELERVVLMSHRAEDECALTQATGGRIVAPGFGASDCRQGCRAHLRWVAKPPVRWIAGSAT